MMSRRLSCALAAAVTAALGLAAAGPVSAEDLCKGFGPQTPRDISVRDGMNTTAWVPAPAADKLNLCNIHTHTNAEHRGPGFQVFKGNDEHGGYGCNDADQLTEAELAPVEHPHFAGVQPGDTIEVHWVFTSCSVNPGPGLGSCLSPACANPELRVEAQVFLLVNDPAARNFNDYVYRGTAGRAHPQPMALPADTGEPVVFAGSTTGPSYTQALCSPLLVTWSVRPQCAKLDINSLHTWAADGNVFDEHHSHGVRQLVTATELLSPIN
ncbi:hypothetical protein ATO13_11771 [Stappia sp. 22II-S9-Z10]|nr:hypothetical protein ATO13_11771 [Stappia sp. 22II-S9-Z10]